MARWQLTEPHTLNVPGNVWEFQTQDRGTGRTIRKQFPVPMHLDPNIEQDWNYKENIGNNVVDGRIIVCHIGKGEPKDIQFTGPPTPGMLPLDDEARELSSKLKQPITQGLEPEQQSAGWQQQLLVQLSDMKESVATAPKIEGMAEFMKAMTEMMKLQTQLIAGLAGKTVPVEAPLVYDPSQHVVDDEVPLDEVAPTEAELKHAAAIAEAKEADSQERAIAKAQTAVPRRR